MCVVSHYEYKHPIVKRHLLVDLRKLLGSGQSQVRKWSITGKEKYEKQTEYGIETNMEVKESNKVLEGFTH